MSSNSLDRPLTILSGMTARTFLNEYWQKKPLLIRAGLTDFELPLEADELAGLAMEEEIEARIVIEKGLAQNNQFAQPWQTLHGPFTEQDFANLPEQEWTLLVQAVDHWVPEIQTIKERFRFLPSWRLDDVMVSYATTGGSVGPHYDQYDVFLIQVAGKRRWQVLSPDDYQDSHIADIPLHILDNFAAQAKMDWEVETGDILYIPPNFAHYGRALDDDCMTYSVGFRAPSWQDVLLGVCDKVSENLAEQGSVNDKRRFAAPSNNDEPHHAEIHSSDIQYLHQELSNFINQPELLADWLATHMTEVKYPEYHSDLPQEESAAALQEALNGTLCFRPGDARLSYRHLGDQNPKIALYCNGDKIEIADELEPLIQVICDQMEFDFSELDTDKHPDILPLLSFLISKQGLILQPPAED